MFKLTNKIAWITGGSEGLGLAIAKLFYQLDASVAINGLHEKSVSAAIEDIGNGATERIMGAVVDVRDDEAMQNFTTKIIDRWGRLDIAVANAGTNGFWAPLETIEPKAWRDTIDINLNGTFTMCRAVLPSMKQQHSGSIVIISSVNGTRTFSSIGASAYATSKAAQLALGKMLALEVASFGIRVNVVCPGAFDTNIHDKTKRQNLESIAIPVEYPDGSIPLTNGDMGNPEQVANLVAFLSSDAAAHITGSPIWIDGGSSLLS